MGNNKLENKGAISWGDVLRKYGCLMALVILMIVFSLSSKYFFTANNLISVALTITTIGLIAIGQTLCIISRNFDMSVGMVASLGGVIYGHLGLAGVPVGVCLLLAVVFGLLAGIINGFCVAHLKMNAFMVTFIMMQIYRGVLYVVTDGMTETIFALEGFSTLGQYKVFGVLPLPILIMAVLYIAFAFILKYTKLGRQVYCVGGNPEAARISGINAKGTMMFCFIITSTFAALAGVCFASRVCSVAPFIGESYALDTISAAVLGGAAMSGGKGTMWGTLIGVLIVGVIQNGLVMAGVSPNYQYIATGVIMFLAILLQERR